MTFKIIEGDLFDPNHGFTSLAQGVNCRGIMGAGIAIPFKTRYPDMYETYKELCAKSAHLLPGTAQVVLMSADDSRPDVINLFSQYQPGANATYEYLERALHSMDQQLTLLVDTSLVIARGILGTNITRTPFDVGLPLIGGGIGGLERHNIIHIMETTLSSSEHEYTLVERP
jgi:O-acetyl-ADP-ribose deacetylase (regulator of RNase III)